MGTAVVAILSGLLTAGAAIAIVLGVFGTEEPTAARSVDWLNVAPRLGRIAGVVTAALLAWVWTGWPVAALLVLAMVWLLPQAVRAAAAQRREQEILEATRAWLQQLRTSLQAGVGLESALRETTRLARPDSPIAGPLRRMADRLDWMGPAEALEGLAADLDNHVADASATVLRSALLHSHRGVAAALHALAVWADEDLKHLRQVDAEARGLRLAKRLVLTIWAGMAVYLAVSSPDLMAPYATFEGQLTLLVLLGIAGLALWLLTWWAGVQRPERFFRRTGVRP